MNEEEEKKEEEKKKKKKKKCILHNILVLQHVSAHHKCHHQGVFVVFIRTLSNGELCGNLNRMFVARKQIKRHP